MTKAITKMISESSMLHISIIRWKSLDISSLSILNYVDMDSEIEILGYGISLILLNVGMYVGIPAIVIVGIRKRF